MMNYEQKVLHNVQLFNFSTKLNDSVQVNKATLNAIGF